MGKGKQTSTQNTVSTPWKAAHPLLQAGLNEALDLFNAGDLTPSPYGNRLAAESPWSSQARNMTANIASAGNPAAAAAQNAYQGVLDSSFGGLDQVKDAALRQAVPAAAGYFENAGMLNSSVAGEGIAEAATRAIAPIHFGAYNQDRQNTLNALGMAPGMTDLAYSDARMLGAAGAADEMRSQRELDEQVRQYYENADNDYENLGRVSQLGMGFGGMGGTSSGSGSQGQSSGIMGMLGAGAGLAGALLPLFSDRRLKENVRKVGETEVKVPVYTYNYKGDPDPKIGVMSDEVPRDMVVKHPSGYDMVDYGKLL